MSWHRSEQKGRHLLRSQVVSVLQNGQRMRHCSRFQKSLSSGEARPWGLLRKPL